MTLTLWSVTLIGVMIIVAEVLRRRRYRSHHATSEPAHGPEEWVSADEIFRGAPIVDFEFYDDAGVMVGTGAGSLIAKIRSKGIVISTAEPVTFTNRSIETLFIRAWGAWFGDDSIMCELDDPVKISPGDGYRLVVSIPVRLDRGGRTRAIAPPPTIPHMAPQNQS